MKEACELTILMPCLNEAETLAVCIQKAKQFLDQEQVKGEILIADNGSTDGSQDIAMTQGVRVVSVSERGYGAALKTGIEAAAGRYVIMGDADDSYNFLHLKPFLDKLREGYDLVMGNRFKGGIMQGAMPFKNRFLGNPALSFLGRLFFNSQLGDFHCGLRGFHRERLQELALQGNGMEFASEMIVKATLKQLKIAEVPTQLFPDGRSRKPHLRPWRDGWRHLRLLLLFSPRWLFFYPGLVLFNLGWLSMLLLLLGPLQLAGLNLDIHTLLFSSVFMVVGLQAVSFAVFAQYLAHKQAAHLPLSGKIFKLFTLERGLIVGLVMVALGLGGSVYALWYWAQHAFGALIPTQMMRLIIPSITFLMLGMQLLFSSFFMSMLSMDAA
ncbi:MAG: dolichol-P-glucose synthetase [Gammaproteobacteria bacterium RIFCSPHIGHO2_12_FULL_45_12]|nr:MAG: dolichol-P-glucose synthetase [Gammaproteobacteria bacterium RIFCSPHIGHO2_12_FULL_45_12]